MAQPLRQPLFKNNPKPKHFRAVLNQNTFLGIRRGVREKVLYGMCISIHDCSEKKLYNMQERQIPSGTESKTANLLISRTANHPKLPKLSNMNPFPYWPIHLHLVNLKHGYPQSNSVKIYLHNMKMRLSVFSYNLRKSQPLQALSSKWLTALIIKDIIS